MAGSPFAARRWPRGLGRRCRSTPAAPHMPTARASSRSISKPARNPGAFAARPAEPGRLRGELRRDGDQLVVVIERNYGFELERLEIDTGRPQRTPLFVGTERIDLVALRLHWRRYSAVHRRAAARVPSRWPAAVGAASAAQVRRSRGACGRLARRCCCFPTRRSRTPTQCGCSDRPPRRPAPCRRPAAMRGPSAWPTTAGCAAASRCWRSPRPMAASCTSKRSPPAARRVGAAGRTPRGGR